MAAYGIPEWDIARVVGIDPKTLRKHYRDELDTGHVKATAKVAEFLFRRATTEGPQAVTAAIFWLKTRGGWREMPQDHHVQVRDVRQMTDVELERYIAASPMADKLFARLDDAGYRRTAPEAVITQLPTKP